MEGTSIIGKGITFPLELNSQGGISMKTGNVLLKSSIQTILSWPSGNRFFNPTFGSRLNELLDEPNDIILQNLVRRFIEEALDTWEKRIKLLDTALSIQNNGKKIQVTLIYEIKETGSIEQLVYPFKI